MYGYTMRVGAPIEAYRALHNAILEIVGDSRVEGLIVHFAAPTDRGFAVTEVWETKEQVDAFNRTVLPQAMERIGMPLDTSDPDITEFDPAVVLIPAAFDSEQRN